MKIVDPELGPESKVDTHGVDVSQIIELLTHGEIQLKGLLPWSSNDTYLVTVWAHSLRGLAVYKPRIGETPLWDFPHGTLCLREVAAYLVDRALGWSLVPPTVLREGPRGLGSVQLYIEADPEQHYFNLREAHLAEFRRLAAFDILVNNADRKGGHCLKDKHDHIWAVDHGITFHAEPKLRTVIWDFAGEPIPTDILADLHAFQHQIDRRSPLLQALERLLSPAEIKALRARLAGLIKAGQFPEPGPYRYYPWPPI